MEWTSSSVLVDTAREGVSREAPGPRTTIIDATPALSTVIAPQEAMLRPPNTRDKLRSFIACAGFVCFIPLFGGAVIGKSWEARDLEARRR